jgi:hypothetical protein
MKIRRPSLSFAARTTGARPRLIVPTPPARGPGLPRLVAGALLAMTAGCAPAAGGDPDPAPITAQQAAITVEPGEVACWKSCDVLRAYVHQYCLDRGAKLNAAKFLCGVAPRSGGGGGGPCERPDGTPPFWIGGRVGFEPTCAATVPQAPDRDADGIPDSRDACPTVAGVASSDPTRNGCPRPPATSSRTASSS